MAYTFEIYKDKAGEVRVKFKYNAENHVLDRRLFEQGERAERD